MNTRKRMKAERDAKVQDIFWNMMWNWDIECRERSSTGENMIKESMDKEDMEALKAKFMAYAESKVK